MYKKSELITVIAFCLVIALLSVGFIIIPDREFSEQENRTLQQFPEFSADSFFSGGFGKSINVYFADQFPLRDTFVTLKSASELSQLKGENNGVLYSKSQLAVKDFMAFRSVVYPTVETDRIFFDSAEAQLQSVARLADKLEIPLLTVLPPRTIDIADSRFSYDRPDGDRIFELMNGILKNAGYIDTLSLLRPKYEQGEYVYYRTDHHWTTEGAYHVYREIMKQLGRENSIIPKESFEIEQINGFSGTTAAKASFPIYDKDILEIWHLPDDDGYKITADGEDLDGFYSREYLETSDKYSVFLDGTHGVTEIKKVGEDRDTLLIAKDSFANCLIPFLAREFDIVALNLATSSPISAYAEMYSADAVLIVYNTENIITSGNLGKIN